MRIGIVQARGSTRLGFGTEFTYTGTLILYQSSVCVCKFWWEVCGRVLG